MKTDYSLTARSGYLTLFGGPFTLSMAGSPTLLLRKQRHWPVVWETKLDFQPKWERVEAGTVVWWNYTCFASIGIRTRRTENRLQRVIRFTPPADTGEVVEQDLSGEDEVRFAIDCTATHYRFGFQRANENDAWTWLAEVDTMVMTRNPQIGAPFTGMMLGLYSYGELQPTLTPAHFAYAEFK